MTTPDASGSSSTFIVSRQSDVVTVTLDRPARLNAFDPEMRTGLAHLWHELAQDSSLRCVVLTGAGKGFCSGADVAALSGERIGEDDVNDELAFLPGNHLDVPVIVAVNGVCAGGGLHFVADADIVVAATSATFLDPHVSVGQVSGIEPSSLVLRVPLPVISMLALCGKGVRLDSAQALRCGLVSEVVADDELLGRAGELARAIASASPSAVRSTRRILRDLQHRLLGESLVEGWDAVRAQWDHPDAHEGPRAAIEQRPPLWKV
jgi:enoyl-CoA hydratase/carnithine racemase